jgi:hypothetical protein
MTLLLFVLSPSLLPLLLQDERLCSSIKTYATLHNKLVSYVKLLDKVCLHLLFKPFMAISTNYLTVFTTEKCNTFNL